MVKKPLPYLLLASALGGVGILIAKAAKAAPPIDVNPPDPYDGPAWSVPAAQVTRTVLLERLADVIIRLAQKVPVARHRVDEAVRIAVAMKMPATAAGVRSESSLPINEQWPGTTMSVAAYIRARITPPPSRTAQGAAAALKPTPSA